MYWTPRGRVYPPPTVRTFLDFGVLKPGFRWVIKFKLTSILAPNVYYDCSTRGGEKLFKMFSNVLDIRGRGGRGIPLPRWGAFLDLWVLKPGFGCIIKLKLTSILAPNIYCSSRGRGGPFLFTPKGRGHPPPLVGTFFEILVQNTSFSCITILKFT